MKNRLLIAGILAFVLVLGMTVAGCDIDGVTGGNNSGTTGGNDYGEDLPLPLSSGVNAVSGKTYFGSAFSKTVFSTTADGAASGTYIISIIESGVYETNDKYSYIDIGTGTYSWNEEAKMVTLKLESFVFEWRVSIRSNVKTTVETTYGPIVDKTTYRSHLQDMVNSSIEEMGEEAFNQELLSKGFSSAADYVNYYDGLFSMNETYSYSFSADGTALFLEQSLPVNKGVNELSGQTYYALASTWDENEEKFVYVDEKDENFTFVFTASGYTCTISTISKDVYEGYEGSYAYDSSRKWVWLRREKINGKDRAAWYAEQMAQMAYTSQMAYTYYSGHHYVDDNAYCAIEANNKFGRYSYTYNSANKTIR